MFGWSFLWNYSLCCCWETQDYLKLDCLELNLRKLLHQTWMLMWMNWRKFNACSFHRYLRKCLNPFFFLHCQTNTNTPFKFFSTLSFPKEDGGKLLDATFIHRFWSASQQFSISRSHSWCWWRFPKSCRKLDEWPIVSSQPDIYVWFSPSLSHRDSSALILSQDCDLSSTTMKGGSSLCRTMWPSCNVSGWLAGKAGSAVCRTLIWDQSEVIKPWNL